MGDEYKVEYSDKEQGVLSLMERTNFKNLSKVDLIGVTSKLGELRPELALEIIKQFPEFARLVQSSIPEFLSTIDKVIDSDDNSINKVYGIYDKGMESAIKRRTEYYSYATEVRSDLNRYYDHPDLSKEERENIVEKQMEILRSVTEKDTEIAEREKDIINKASEKDSEKRQFNWRSIRGVSFGLLAVVVTGATLLGNDFNLPDKFSI